ncbi:MAG: terpene cyclase/mutase family protein [Myxococcales bacterium]|nr:terpene cyclase/mutase family protein [Myxococcales bacterium]
MAERDSNSVALTRRTLLGSLAASSGCGWFFPKSEKQRSLDEGVAWLLAQQQEDGGFKSSVYGFMRPGHSLTPLALLALHACGVNTAATDRALAFVVRSIDTDGALGLLTVPDYPMYATSMAIQALSRFTPAGWEQPAERMARWVRSQQLTGEAWRSHPSRGGFPMGARTPRTPPDAGHVDLSMTRRALQALAALDASAADPALEEGRRFVQRCSAGDGAFLYSPGEPALNKGRDPEAGYGTPTCDAVLSLLATGGAQDLLEGGVAWLSRRFRVDENPAVGATAMRRFARAMRFYWRASVAEVFRATSAGPARWQDHLAVALVDEQRPDGSWANSLPDQKEDDPVVCTSLALTALATSTGFRTSGG